MCKKGPISHYLFFCKECNYIYCPACEKIEGPRHSHSLYKVQNVYQYDYLELNKISKFDQFIDGVGSKIEGAYNKVLGFFGKKKNNENNRIDISKKYDTRPTPQWISLVQVARSTYELSNYTDEQIEDALIKSKGNVEEAITFLVQ